MIITRLQRGNAQFPKSKEVGDVVVFANGDIFCYDGQIWQLIGGRFIPERMRREFLDYISTGWPDVSSAKFDLPHIFDLSVFSDHAIETEGPATDPRFIKRFIDRVVEVSEKCQRAK